MNAIAWDPLKGDLVDPHNGREDIESGVIRAVGNAHERLVRMAPFTSCPQISSGTRL